MKRSESIKEISLALAKAQGEMPIIGFDKKSHNNRYASLTAIVEGTQPTLSKHGLSIIQTFSAGKDTNLIVTSLLHSSGEWLEDDGVPLIMDKQNMQGLGSAITYAKRYGMSAMLRIVTDEDDDGNAAVKPSQPQNVADIKDAFPGSMIKESASLGDYKPTFGQYKGVPLSNIELRDLQKYVAYLKAGVEKDKQDRKPPKGYVDEFIRAVEGYAMESNGLGF